ncbi:MAG: flagellar motor protein [Candidatus Tectomicrobia bacterium]|uniref:Flagellar motor protein n=1 Tax=Tectimicrobiota bacterium TaxID=2528274 RepID=A0A933GLR1_UNCTE|nr:flagellar motor protein [Candidatus Tectomicrobia bacterium]
MDITTIIGLLLGVLAIVGGFMLEHGDIKSIIQPTAAIIVLGGTLGAICLSYPLRDLLGLSKELMGVFFNPKEDAKGIVDKIIEYAIKARKNGLISLEMDVKEITDPFLSKALTLVIDGVDPQVIHDTMETEIENDEETHKGYAKVFESAGGYAPTIGIIGAVLGLIQTMRSLSDPAELGKGIAVAFVATIYGVGSANLLFLPIANKLKVKHRTGVLLKQMILKGILGIQAGENPQIIRERLMVFLSKTERDELRK